MEYLKDDSADLQKILFTGLDAAGKTSIILALKREFSKIANIEPTKSVNRKIFEFMGKSVCSWDLGGQISYRISYLKKPGVYFDNTEVAIYVIDIQKRDRLPESLSYLNDVINQFRYLEIEPPIYVFFHKYDQFLNDEAQNELDNFLLNLQGKIIELLDYNKIFFYKTSIYSLSTIIKAMSEIFLSIYPKANLIQKAIEEFASKFEAEGIEVIDDNSLIVGSYYQNETARDILNQTTPYFLSLNDSFQYAEVAQEENDSDNMIIYRFGRFFLFSKFQMKGGSPPYYILAIREDPTYNKEIYEAFIGLLQSIV